MRGCRGRQPPDPRWGGSVLPPHLGTGTEGQKGSPPVQVVHSRFMRKRFIDDEAVSEGDADDIGDAEAGEEDLTLTSLDEEAIREIVLECLAEWHTASAERKASLAEASVASRQAFVPDGSNGSSAVHVAAPAAPVQSTVSPQPLGVRSQTLGIRPLRLKAARASGVRSQAFAPVPESVSATAMETDEKSGASSQSQSAVH